MDSLCLIAGFTHDGNAKSSVIQTSNRISIYTKGKNNVHFEFDTCLLLVIISKTTIKWSFEHQVFLDTSCYPNLF